MQARNITLDANSITLSLDGDYKIDCSAIMQVTGAAFDVVLAIRVNGIEIAALSPGTDFESFTLSAIMPLAAGDVLDSALYSATGGSVLLGPAQNATLVAMWLRDWAS